MQPRIEPRQGFFANAWSAAPASASAATWNPARVFARHPRLMFGYMNANRNAERTPAPVQSRLPNWGAARGDDGRLRVLHRHRPPSTRAAAGLSDDQLRALHDAHASDLFDDDQLLVIDLATGMSTTPGEVEEELMQRAQARFGVKGTMELVRLIAWENARARMNVALGIGAEGFSAGKACALPYTAAGIDCHVDDEPVPDVARSIRS